MDLRKTVSGKKQKFICEGEHGAVERTRKPKKTSIVSRYLGQHPRDSFGRLQKKGWTSLGLILLICKMQEIDWIGQGDSCSSLAAKSFILFLITFRVEPQDPQADKK